MKPIEQNDTISLQCAACDQQVMPHEKFCGYCGKEINRTESHRGEDAFSLLSPTLIYYFVTLILLSAYKFTDLFPEGIQGLIVVSVIDIGIVLVFWSKFYQPLKSLFSLQKISTKPLLLTIGGAVAGAVAVTFIAAAINVTIYDDVYYGPYMFDDTNNPLIWAIVMTCLQPAIFEEVAFRGFLYTNIHGLTSPSNAVYISSFLFGVLHLSFISLLWLVPIGLVFAWMRMRYNTLWYGIVGHFYYNLTITVIEFYSN